MEMLRDVESLVKVVVDSRYDEDDENGSYLQILMLYIYLSLSSPYPEILN